METVRVRLDLAYDGARFAGWSRQPGQRTVQGVIESALATLVRDDERAVRLVVAGRTDAGVHATGQVAHADVTAEHWQLLRRRGASGDGAIALHRRLNGVLARDSDDVVVHRVSRAPAGFDARFSPLWRRYEYRVADARALRDPRRRGHTLWHDGELDDAAMDLASHALTGLHDFAAFCRPREGATTIRTLLDFGWSRDSDGVLVARVRADAFCHSMVRALVGGAMAVGQGRLDQDGLRAVLDGARRVNAFPVVAARGLTLVEVAYPDDEELQSRAAQTRARRAPLAPEDSSSD